MARGVSPDSAAERLLRDLNSKRPSVPSEVVWAYQNADVVKAVAKRVSAGQIQLSVAPVLPDPVLRLRRVYFDFSGRDGSPTGGILVQVGDDNKVKEIIDPFTLPVASTTAGRGGSMPLYFSRPMITSQVGIMQFMEKWEAFIKRDGLARSFEGMPGFADFASGTCVPTQSDTIAVGPEQPDNDMNYEEDDDRARGDFGLDNSPPGGDPGDIFPGVPR